MSQVPAGTCTRVPGAQHVRTVPVGHGDGAVLTYGGAPGDFVVDGPGRLGPVQPGQAPWSGG